MKGYQWGTQCSAAGLAMCGDLGSLGQGTGQSPFHKSAHARPGCPSLVPSSSQSRPLVFPHFSSPPTILFRTCSLSDDEFSLFWESMFNITRGQ